jgi:hypothetical protein
MKIINQNGYSTDELRSWRIIVYRNIIESAQALVQAIQNFELTFDKNENSVNIMLIGERGKRMFERDLKGEAIFFPITFRIMLLL